MLTISGVLDHELILRNTPNLENLKVTLQKSENKGCGLFATKPIRKGEIIAYYKLKIYNERQYKSPTNWIYSCSVYTKKGDPITCLIGDLYEDSVPPPLNDIPFWGHFANEPNLNERSNSELNTNSKHNYRNRQNFKIGDILLYELVATHYIEPKHEVLWYYGEEYPRKYRVSKL